MYLVSCIPCCRQRRPKTGRPPGRRFVRQRNRWNQTKKKPAHQLPACTGSPRRIKRGPRGDYLTTSVFPTYWTPAMGSDDQAPAIGLKPAQHAYGCASVSIVNGGMAAVAIRAARSGAQPLPATRNIPMYLCTPARMRCSSRNRTPVALLPCLWPWLPWLPWLPSPHLPPAWRLRFDVQPPPCAK